MTSTEPEQLATTLTSDDVAALRAADAVLFYTYQGVGYIRAVLHSAVTEPRIYSVREQRLFTEAGTVGTHERERTIRTYWSAISYADLGEVRLESPRAFATVSGGAYSPVWPSIAGLIRTGDELTLRWRAGNNNGYLNNAGLYRDDLFIELRSAKRTVTLYVDTSITPDNSARMIHTA